MDASHALWASRLAATSLQIETAYDILFMQSMKKRLAGEGVAAKIRYADVAKRKPVKQVIYTLVFLFPC